MRGRLVSPRSMMLDLLACRSWQPLLPLPRGAVGSVNGLPLSRDAFDLHYAQSERAVDGTAAAPTSAERRARREAIANAIEQELIRQRADALAVEYDAAELALREQRAERGLEGDCQNHLPWWRARVISELRVAAIVHAEGWRRPSDAETALVLDSMIASGFLHGEAVVLAEIEVFERAEAERLCTLARAPHADFSALASAFSCGSTALSGGSLGVLPLRSPEGCVGQALAPGEVSDPIECSRARNAHTTWRIVRCFERLPAAQVGSSPIAIACMRDHLAHSSMASVRAALIRRLRRAAFIDDRIEATMSTAVIQVQLPEVLAEVGGRSIAGPELLDEMGPRLLFDAAREDRIAWETEHRVARHFALHGIVRRERMLIEAVARGELTSMQAERMRRSSPPRGEEDALAWARARLAWANELQQTLEARLLPLPEETADRPLRGDFEDIAHLHRSLRRRYPARYMVDDAWIDDVALDLSLDDDREAMLETDELDRAR